jgi:hypothetical protein
MLAVDFVGRHEECATWYKVDAPDMSLPVFMEYLVASVARVRPGFDRQTLDCVARPASEANSISRRWRKPMSMI